MAMDKTKKFKMESVREWLPLDRAAKALTPYFEDEVEPADLLQLALEQKIKLSVLLTTSEPALGAEVTPSTEALEEQLLDKKYINNGVEIRVREKRTYYVEGEDKEKKDVKPIRLKRQNPRTIEAEKYNLLLAIDSKAPVTHVSGIWDLPIFEGSKQEIEDLLHSYLFDNEDEDEDEDEEMTFEEWMESNHDYRPVDPMWLVNSDHTEWLQLQEKREEQDRVAEAERYQIPHENPFSMFLMDFDGSLMKKFMAIPEVAEDFKLLRDSERALSVEQLLKKATSVERGIDSKTIVPANVSTAYILLNKRVLNSDLREQLRKKWDDQLPSHYEPAYYLPEKSLIVVRSAEILRFIENISAPKPPKESSRQRNTIIGSQGGISADTALLLVSTLTDISKRLSPPNKQSQQALYYEYKQDFSEISVSKSTFDKVLAEANRLKKNL
jgi:hypothetical protein